MISSVVRTVLVYLAVVVAMRLMGKRQLGELQPAELVTTLLISNVASICIDEPDLPLSASLVPIFLITALEILNSTLVWFCPKYAQLLLGKPVTIIRNGEISQYCGLPPREVFCASRHPTWPRPCAARTSFPPRMFTGA